MNPALKPYVDLLARYVRPQRGRFALLAVLLPAGIALQVANPQIMRFFIDTALARGPLQVLFGAAGVFLAIAILQQVVAVAVAYLGESVAWTATNRLHADLARHCLALDMNFHNRRTPGELIERIDGDVSEVATFFSQFVVTVLGHLLLIVGILIALYLEDVRAGVVFTLFAAASLGAMARARRIAVEPLRARRQAEAELFGFVEEQLAGTEDVRASGATGWSLGELVRLQGGVLRHERVGALKTFVLERIVATTLIFGNLLAVGGGYLLFQRGAITLGTVYLFIYYTNLLESPLWALTRQMQNLQTVGACVERLGELQALRPVVVDPGEPDAASASRDGATRPDPAHAEASTGGAGPVAGTGKAIARPAALAFEQVSFDYGSGDTVLRDLSFTLEAGKVLGLLGRTGSGKSTLTRLVFRLYDPTEGKIRLDGSDLRTCALGDLRRRVGLVTQEVQLFQATVRDNLTFFDRSIPDEALHRALRELELDEWLAGLPSGLDTPLTAGGKSLSAGEAQLLAFARVFLRDPGLVILDEASSRLDPATERRIERAIDRLLAGRSALIVAHRLATVSRADHIMILDDGKIFEYGERRALAADPSSVFHGLLRTGLEEVLA